MTELIANQFDIPAKDCLLTGLDGSLGGRRIIKSKIELLFYHIKTILYLIKTHLLHIRRTHE